MARALSLLLLALPVVMTMRTFFGEWSGVAHALYIDRPSETAGTPEGRHVSENHCVLGLSRLDNYVDSSSASCEFEHMLHLLGGL